MLVTIGDRYVEADAPVRGSMSPWHRYAVNGKAVAHAMGVAPAALGNGWIGKIWKPPAVPAGNLGLPSTES